MVDREKLSGAVGSIAWGYVLIYFNFNIGPADILPNWLGLIFINMSLKIIGEEEKSALLLQPLALILVVWELFCWFIAFINFTPTGFIFTCLSTIVVVVNLYFNFQLLTNLANIAQKYGCYEHGSILKLRTIYTLLITFVAIPWPEEIMEIIAIIMIGVVVLVIIGSCIVLFSFKKSLRNC